jgi:hypothetical protein
MLNTSPQNPFPPIPILQSLEQMPHEIPIESLGGFGGNPNTSRLSACTLSVILMAFSGFPRIQDRQTPSLLEIIGECSPQIWHCPNLYTKKF